MDPRSPCAHTDSPKRTATIPDASTLPPPERVACAIALPPEIWLKDLKAAGRARLMWLWQGYVARGTVTLLTSQWKSGKTTLVSVLLARLKSGGMLAGLPVTAGKAVVVSEEDPLRWYERSQRLDFGEHVCWMCRPFRGKPSPEEWLALIDRLAELQARHGLHLAVLDPLASFLPGRDENTAGTMIEALTALRRLTDLGLAVLLNHHPRKGGSPAGQSARGSGALPAYVDILLEMHWHNRNSVEDRRRRLCAYSRHPETPRQRIIELTADGTDYVALGDLEDESYTANWKILRIVLEDARQKLTRQQIQEEWPADFERPKDATLWRCLTHAVNRGEVRQDGSGRRLDPFRYWLPAKEEMFEKDPLIALTANLEQQQRDYLQDLFRKRPSNTPLDNIATPR